MSRLIIIFLINILLKTSFTQDLRQAIVKTEKFFNTLMEKYESIELTDETKKLIDQEIDRYLKEVLNEFKNSHPEREPHETNIHETGVEIYDGLKAILNLNVTDVKDVHFFKNYNGYEQWFATTLTSSGVIVYRVVENTFAIVAYYPVDDASKIHVVKFYGTVLFIVQTSQSVLVLYFYSQDEKFTIRGIQNLVVPNIKHLSLWHEINQMFMCTSSSIKTHVYAWQRENFALLQEFAFDSDFCSLIHLDTSKFLIVSGSYGTSILSHQSGTSQFFDIQFIRRSFHDVTFARLIHKSKYADEGLLVLAGTTATIVYKYSKVDDVFVPFQQLTPADKVIKVLRNNIPVLLLVKDRVVDVYQYDGWRFKRLDHQLFEVEEIKVVVLSGEELVLIKRIDNSWSLNRIIWSKIKEPFDMKGEIYQWCLDAKERAKKIPEPLPEPKHPIQFTKGHIRKIKAKNINGLNVKKLYDLTERYNKLASRIAKVNESLSQAIPLVNATFDNLRVDTVYANCTKQCSAKKLVTKMKCNNFSNFRTIRNESQKLMFEHVKVDKLDGFPCPKPAVGIQEINVKGLVNGIKFEDLEKNALKTSGDQVVTAEHIFTNLQVDSIVAPNLDVASTETRQKIIANDIYAEELILTDGGILLPLDGEPVTMTGTLTARKAKFTGLVEQRGALKGKAIERYRPLTYFDGYYELRGDYILNDVMVTGLLSAEDVTRERGRSLKEIAEGAIPLDGDVPVRMRFMKDRTYWTNITVENLPKWLTKKNSQMVQVTGKKIALKPVTIPDSVYAKLPVPKIDAFACSIGAVTPDIKTSTLRVGQATADIVHSEDIFGANELENIMNDSITSLDEIDLSQQNLTGFVHVENLNISDFEESPFYSFKKSKFKWYQPDHIEGPIEAESLNVGSLNTLGGLKIPLPKKIRNMVVEGNLQVKTINGIDIDEFLKNMVRIDEDISLNNVTFVGSVEVDEIEAENTNIDLRSLEDNVNLGNKTIAGDLEIDGDLWIPNILLSYPDGEDLTFLVEGSVTFAKEPNVENLNGENLQKLISKIWMQNRDANLTGNIYMKNVTLIEPFLSYEQLHTPKFGSWESFEKRLFSKTKLQDIQVPVYFREVTFPNIVTEGHSTMRSSDPYLNDLLYMTLKKNESQTIKEKWRFKELIITDNLVLDGKINNLNLSTDVARYDVEINRVTGKKVVDELIAENLYGLNFGEWAKDALMKTTDTDKVIVINGKKNFNVFTARNVNVSGTIMGKKLEDCLQKTGDQVITAPKVIKGSLHTPSMTVGGLINDVNLTEFINSLLKKSEPHQIIKSKMVFKNDLEILGNVTIQGKIQGVELEKPNEINQALIPLVNFVEYLQPFAAAIADVSERRAKFWNKFDLVEENILLPIHNQVPSLYDSSTFYVLGTCIMRTLSEMMCNDQNRYTLKVFSTDLANIIISQMISIESIPHVVQVTSGPRSRITVFMYRNETNSFDIATSIRAPGILEASVSTLDGVVWIATRLNSEMFIVRYKPYFDMHKYHLPESRFFALTIVPATNELILVREDGMWKLEGLAGPRHTFKAKLPGDRVETFTLDDDFFVRLMSKNNDTVLLKALYVGI